MPDIPLTDALAALIEDLRRLPSGHTVGGVEVELSLVVHEDRGRVRWQVARPGDTGTQRIRLTVQPWRQQPWPEPPRPEPPARTRYPDLDETQVGLDPKHVGSANLPPIVRPKPGVDVERDAD
ncbi:hypothetical protein QQG74_22125 [Micromonospora sp. FIMYZ51]|uniref:hypothetical protein n=1 Tax=Micromonospora sp. FIMYZ51 TaxID=3051832 RepID=UPI00311F5733